LTVEVGALAAAAQASVYALRLDEAMFDSAMQRKRPDLLSDREARSAGLETLVGAARGTIFNVSGSGAGFFERLNTELSGYYLLGVESDPGDRDGKPHPIRVEVAGGRRATVRARRQYVSLETGAAEPARSPRQIVTDGLRMPLVMSALPLRVASFALRGPEQDKVQLLIHADIGSGYAAARPVAIGYLLLDLEGRVLDSRASDARLAPVMNGVPSPLQFTMGASVAPGEYRLKLAVAEGDRLGTVEHTIQASVPEVNGVGLSGLMVGGPTAGGDLVRPTIGYTASFGTVHGYLEAYGPKSGEVSVRYEVAAADDAPALVSADAPPRRAGGDRALFSRVLPLQQLPAGKYVMRAVVSEGGKPVTTMTRAFEVAPPAVLMTSAEGVGAAPAAVTELYLPVADDLLARPFERDQAIASGTIQAFRSRVPQEVKAAFEAGFGFIVAGDFQKAETALKQAINPEFDSTAALSYLAVCYAAAGHDDEAASAWQSALAEGGDIPQIYDWLGGALLRTHDVSAARSIYEEAAEKWPADARFMKPLAMIYANFGRGREAFLMLERYLASPESPVVSGFSRTMEDADALFLAVQWLYHVRAAGGAVHTPAQDLKLARTYAAAYEKTGGSQAALVSQWLAFLQK
jgi:tetratricopeptide (TPR) repeat protein